MKTSFQSRWCVVWSCILAVVTLIRAEKPVAGRRSRQAQEEEGLEGVWSPWGEWTECSQSCGLGVSERRRKCLPPPPTPPHTWAGPSYLLPGIPSHTPVISAVRPYHPSHYPGSEPPQYGGGGGGERPPFYPPPPRVANEIPGLPLYRNEPGGSGPEPSNQAPPFYRPEFPASSHNPVSIYRSPPLPSSPASSSLPYGQSGRVFRRPPNQGVGRAAGGGSRRSVSASRDPSHARRSGSSIRPGQFGYGRVPFSLPLHRTNRHARHTRRHGNATVATPDTKVGGHDPSLRGSEDRAEAEVEKRGEEEREGANKQEVGGNGRTKEGARGGQERMEREDTKYATESGSPVTEERNGGAERERDRTRERALHHGGATQRHGPAHAGRGRHVERRAPPPVASHPYPSPPFHTPYALPASGPQSQPHPPPPNPNIWPLQGGPHPHRPQPLPADRGADRGPDRGAWSRPQPSQNYRCSGRDREYRRCFAQSFGEGGLRRVSGLSHSRVTDLTRAGPDLFAY
ncbi:ADAMTS-like protein 4 [Chanos chanos]|uniref:ADAMTS-like protein 4 n=1 Tax=Chanos chanos TaxID=29144 RepID=A0A6J2WAL5_CHACN|nr:ADAMTS-like protein 4 [Chanos chanos]